MIRRRVTPPMALTWAAAAAAVTIVMVVFGPSVIQAMLSPCEESSGTCSMAASSPDAAPEYEGFLIRPMGAEAADESDHVQMLSDLGYCAKDISAVGTDGWMLVDPSKANPDAKHGGLAALGTPESTEEILQDFRSRGYEAEPNYVMNAQVVPNDVLYSSIAANMKLINAESAWDISRGSKSVKVCVIDSGIQFKHPDLAGNVITVFDATSEGNMTPAPPENDVHGHGTHCTGTVGAVGNNRIFVTGVSWSVSILGCKFLDSKGRGNTATAIKCINWCRQQGAKITSNSWGSRSPATTALVDAIRASQDAGHLFIAAAGNDGIDIDVNTFSPGGINLPAIISVGAVDSADKMAYFSNHGKKTVHLFAPGVNITSTFPTDSYKALSGTSMATPHVSGAAAVLWAYRPSATAAQIKEALLKGVDVVSGAALSQTGGRLNLRRSLQVLQNTFPLLEIVQELEADSSCPMMPEGYTFRAQQDVLGSDIYCAAVGNKTLHDLSGLCSATSGCTAFNVWSAPGGPWHFCLKSEFANTKFADLSKGFMSNRCQGIYVRSCGPQPRGYTFRAQQDILGNDIFCEALGTRTTNDLASLCSSTMGCTGFNTWSNPDEPWQFCLKNALHYRHFANLSAGSMANRCQGIYVLGGCMAVPEGYTFRSQQDPLGNDIVCEALGARTTSDVASLCSATSGCTAFNTWSAPGGPWHYCLKNAATYTVFANATKGLMSNRCQGIYLRS
ncbi:hypothetical protein Vretimale_13223 [Volvox reticuliferus]|uniref:Peptidase S8/S53 domain-containing protein n=1 Tax=Volvox reticuliferus TaxID=1737510 RepID=A0A8J4FVD4_9CHLO|nr:hypothetical protein Vretifemale_14135 [Volvox reticuliferus]GIM09309.1 hypothetical protein Vretimale_13223 [Volvox reticuliferus]